VTRRLTREESALWERLRRSVKPLRLQPGDSNASKEQGADQLRAATSAQKSKPRAAPSHVKPPLVSLEQRTRRRLARGLIKVDARIDLHGMRQERAFRALHAFLKRAQARGEQIVLVITGKGREGEDGRGVLRENVPAWLSRPEFRDLIVGFEEAGRRHGGAGALYVRIRRRRQRAPGEV
jgi:DNA-nicking Smr family endonuclease